ncbi:MAG: DUF255 domain-containing protein, partial [Cytophagales bacterium]|nr:DUF255 domain-containing protein [Cytophagales bacterium]
MLRKLLILILVLTGVQSYAQTEEIHWLSFEEAMVLNEKNPKKILVDIYTDWCGWCKRMDKDTYEKAEIIKIVNEKYYA